MSLIFGIAVAFVLLTILALTCFYYYHLVCFCLPRQRKEGCFVDLEKSVYAPTILTCMGSCYWVCFFNRDIKMNKVVYLYDGTKVFYNSIGESTPLLQSSSYHDACPICLDQFFQNNELIKLSCQHTYHKHCIRQWIADKCVSKCPLCNQDVFSETIVIEDVPYERRRIGRRIYLQHPPLLL